MNTTISVLPNEIDPESYDREKIGEIAEVGKGALRLTEHISPKPFVRIREEPVQRLTIPGSHALPNIGESQVERFDSGMHPLKAQQGLLEDIKLLKADVFKALPCPLPRCQDLPDDAFGIPDVGDIVIAVSHAWRNQSHPDPTGDKKRYLENLLLNYTSKMHNKNVFMFFDFISLTQRPFLIGQNPRTAEQEQRFQLAMSCMHNIYFFSDFIVHLPFHDVEIDDEEQEYQVATSRLEGSVYAQIGPWVQIVDRERESDVMEHCNTGKSDSGTSTTSLRNYIRGLSNIPTGYVTAASMKSASPRASIHPSPFDRVIAVGGYDVTSLEQMHSLLAQQSSSAPCTARLCRLPFGKINRTHADDRGWLFLERFICMVKCAMLEPEDASQVFYSGSDKLHGEIIKGAERLREAARIDHALNRSTSYSVVGTATQSTTQTQTTQTTKSVCSSVRSSLGTSMRSSAGSSFRSSVTSSIRSSIGSSLRSTRSSASEENSLTNLGTEFSSFLSELAQKKFSSVSIDKQQACDEAVAPDAAIVKNIMTEFVQRLDADWQLEVVEQQRRFANFRNVLERYFVAWDEFSAEYIRKLEASSTADPTPILCLCLIGTLAPLASTLVPYESPEDGWQAQTMFFFYAQPFGAALSLGVCVSLWTALLELKCDRSWALKSCIFLCFLGANCGFIAYTLCALWDIFPVPFMQLMVSSVVTPFTVLYWWCVPAARRAKPGFHWQAFYAYLSFWAMLGIFAVPLPLLNVVLLRVGPWWQALLLLYYLISKLSFEYLVGVLSRHLGADSMPVVVFLSAYMYEYNLCGALASGFHPLIFTELLSFDAIENAYYLWFLRRWMQRVGGESTMRKQMYIISALCLRELVEVVVPLQFLVQFLLMRWVQPRPNQLVCSLSDAEFQHGVILLVVDIAAEMSIGISTYVLLRMSGFSPLRTLRGLIATSFPLFILGSVGISTYLSITQHSHLGADLTFEFKWLRDTEARWNCGLSWA